MDGLHRQLAMTRMELVIKDSQMYRPLVLLALIILGINKGKVQVFLMVLVLAAMEPVVLGRTAMEPVVLVLVAMEPLAGLAEDMTAVLAAMEPVDFRVVWEVDLLAIPEVVVSWVVIFLEEVRVVPVEGFLIIPEVAVFRVVISLEEVLLVVGLEVHLAVPQMVMEEGFLAVFMEEGFLAVFMEEAVNFLDG